MKKKKNNYLIAVLLGLGIIFITLYIFKWYKVFNEEKIKESYLISTKTITNEINSLEELEPVLSEAPSEYFLYIGYTNDEDVYNMEVELRKIIRKYNLQEKFYYLNIDSIRNDQSYIDKLNETLKLTDEKIVSTPTILYFKDHQIVDGGIIKTDSNALMQDTDFEQMLETLEIEKNSD